MHDEDSVKKLVAETFLALWLTPVDNPSALYKKVLHITDTVHLCRDNDSMEHIEALLHTLLKEADARTTQSAQAIVNCLVLNVLNIEDTRAQNGNCDCTGSS